MPTIKEKRITNTFLTFLSNWSSDSSQILTETVNSWKEPEPSCRVKAWSMKSRCCSKELLGGSSYFLPWFHVRTYVRMYVVFTVIPRPVLIKRTSIDRFVERIWNRARMETEIAKLTRIAEKPQASQPESLAAELDSPMVSLCSKRSTMETWRL